MEKLLIRLNERLKVYRDSPSITVTYIDLAHLVENVIEIIEAKEPMGFHTNFNKDDVEKLKRGEL